MLAQR